MVHTKGASQVGDVPLTCRADKKAVRRTISASNEPDLFWGMRGAGGNLGVAIEYTTYAFEVPDNVRITAPPRSAALQGWKYGNNNAPDSQ